MKSVLFVFDGIADEPIESLDGKTPLEVAKTPHLNALAQTGCVGRLRLADSKIIPTEETSCIGLLGYEPTSERTARGPLNAASIELKTDGDQWLLACRLVTTADGKLVDAHAGGISDRETAALYEMLNRSFKDQGVRFFTADGRCYVLTLQAGAVNGKWGELDLREPVEMLGKELWGGWTKTPAGAQLKALLSDVADLLETHEINKVRVDLNENPANALWTWGAGKTLRLEPFAAAKKAAVLSSSDVWKGAAHAAGIPWAPALRGLQAETGDLPELATRLSDWMRSHDFVVLHLNEADRAALGGDFKRKIRWIEAFDQHLIGNLRERSANTPGIKISVVSGHVTSSGRRERTASEAPFLIWGSGVESAPQPEFTEEASARGGKTVVGGADFLKNIL